MKKVPILPTPKAAIGIKVDKPKLRASADKYLNASAVYAALLAVSKFNFNHLATFWRNVVSLVNTIISAVELAKSEFKGVPGSTAASVAVGILDDTITFSSLDPRFFRCYTPLEGQKQKSIGLSIYSSLTIHN